jgi:hypothetical protein
MRRARKGRGPTPQSTRHGRFGRIAGAAANRTQRRSGPCGSPARRLLRPVDAATLDVIRATDQEDRPSMSVAAAHVPPRSSVARLATERSLALASIGLVGLHVADDNFLQPEPGMSAVDHLPGGLALLALVAAGAGRTPASVPAPARQSRCSPASSAFSPPRRPSTTPPSTRLPATTSPATSRWWRASCFSASDSRRSGGHAAERIAVGAATPVVASPLSEPSA